MAFEHLNDALKQRKSAGLLRKRKVATMLQGALINIEGKELIDFSSNDYLGLQQSESVTSAWQKGLATYGNGSGASPLVTGFSQAHRELEMYLALSLKREAVLLFNSGFAANQAICQSLIGKQDSIIADKLSHASLIDGALACSGQLLRFKHNDLAHLQTQLAKSSGNKLLVTEGVFSMDGDQAPLLALSKIATDSNAWLMVDDAHGFGWLGENGLGSAEHFALNQQQLPVLMATFGKAVGTGGAFIAGSQVMIDYLINHARHYIYSTAMPPAQASATLAAVKQIIDEPQLRAQLKENIDWFKQCASEAGLSCLPSDSPIQPIVCSDNHNAVDVSEKLQQLGFCVVAIRPPTVPVGTSRLRVTLSALHSRNHITELVSAIAGLMR